MGHDYTFEPTRTAGIHRGDMIREIVSGMVGVCNGISVSEEGSQMVSIQPRSEDGKRPDEPLWFDEKACEIVDTALRTRFGYAEEYLGYEFGTLVEDVYSGQCGRLTEIVLYQNGCIKGLVVPRSNGGDRDPKPFWIGQHRLAVVGEVAGLETNNPYGGAPTFEKPA